MCVCVYHQKFTDILDINHTRTRRMVSWRYMIRCKKQDIKSVLRIYICIYIYMGAGGGGEKGYSMIRLLLHLLDGKNISTFFIFFGFI